MTKIVNYAIKMKAEPVSHHMKTNSKWIRTKHIRCKNFLILVENIFQFFLTLKGKAFFKRQRGTHVHPWLIHVNVRQKPPQYCNWSPIKINKLIFLKRSIHYNTLINLTVKNKDVSPLKVTLGKVKNQVTNWEKISPTYKIIKELVSRIY